MGFITVGGGPHFLVLDAADKGAIGENLYYHAKVGSFCDRIRVLRDSIGFCLFVGKGCWNMGDIAILTVILSF